LYIDYSVAIYNDMVVYGLYTGQFYINDIKTGDLIRKIDISDVNIPSPSQPVEIITRNKREISDINISNPIPMQRTPQIIAGQIYNDRSSLVPMTLSLNSHILLTNGKKPGDIYAFSLPTKSVTIISESVAMQNHGFSVPGYRNIRFAELSRDGSQIFTSVEFEGNDSLLVWDYGDKNRRVSKVRLAASVIIDVWVGWE
jgi:hypothetical protein